MTFHATEDVHPNLQHIELDAQAVHQPGARCADALRPVAQDGADAIGRQIDGCAMHAQLAEEI